MKKEIKRQLFMSIVLMVLISITLYLWYDSFSFQTYTKITDQQLCFYYQDEELRVDGFELYHKNQRIQSGGARIEGLDILKEDQLNIECQIFSDQTISLKYEIQVENNNQVLYLDYQDIEDIHLDNIQKVQMHISNKRKNKEVYKKDFLLNQLKLMTYTGSNKDYSLANAYLGDNWFKAGYFNSKDDELSQKYPTMIIDYLYLKDNGDENNLDDYQRFIHHEGKTDDFLKGATDVYYYTNSEVDLKKRKICAIITMQGKEDFTFRINLDPTINEGEQ